MVRVDLVAELRVQVEVVFLHGGMMLVHSLEALLLALSAATGVGV